MSVGVTVGALVAGCGVVVESITGCEFVSVSAVDCKGDGGVVELWHDDNINIANVTDQIRFFIFIICLPFITHFLIMSAVRLKKTFRKFPLNRLQNNDSSLPHLKLLNSLIAFVHCLLSLVRNNSDNTRWGQNFKKRIKHGP